MKTRKPRLLTRVLLIAAIATAAVQARSEDAASTLTIPAQSLEAALTALGKQTGMTIVFKPEAVAGRTSPALSGNFSRRAALETLLKDSGLSFDFIDEETAVVELRAKPSPPAGNPAPPPESDTSSVRPIASDQLAAMVVVTAEKREMDVQRVPAAITVFTGETLSKGAINNTMDLALHTPGLHMSKNLLSGQPYIRGVGGDFFSVAADPGVAVHIDGVYASRPASALQEFFDVERVEVVKGPQGTLYGRNATGGAINIISRMPTAEPDMRANAIIGSLDRFRFEGGVGGPILGDKLRGRASFVRHKRAGYTENLFNGRDLDSVDFVAGRVTLQSILAPALDMVLRVDYSDQSPEGQALKVSGANPAIGLGGTVPEDEREIYSDFRNDQNLRSVGVGLEVNWDTAIGTLTSVTGFRENDQTTYVDADRTEIAFIEDIYVEDSRTYTQELRLASPAGGTFEWIFGLFYLKEDAQQAINLDLPLLSLTQVIAGDGETEAFAAFFQGSWLVSDHLKLTLGMRQSHEEKRHFFTQHVNGIPVIEDPGENDWNAFTPRLAAEYRPREDIMLYASASRGFRSGGFNSQASQSSFDPEYVDSYEIGLKATLPEYGFRGSLSAFFYDYSDIQVQRWENATSVSTIVNAAEATVKGIEAEMFIVPFRGAQIDLALALLDAKFDEFFAENPNEPQLGVLDLSGKDLPRAPSLTGTLGLEYQFATGGLTSGVPGHVSLRGEYQYRGEVFYDAFNDPLIRQGGFGVWNARVSWETDDGKWRVAAFGENLGDKAYAYLGARLDGLVGRAIGYEQPRMYGLEVNYSF